MTVEVASLFAAMNAMANARTSSQEQSPELPECQTMLRGDGQRQNLFAGTVPRTARVSDNASRRRIVGANTLDSAGRPVILFPCRVLPKNKCFQPRKRWHFRKQGRTDKCPDCGAVLRVATK